MKTVYVCIALSFSVFMAANAQIKESSPTDLLTSKRSPEERIKFLLEVGQAYFSDDDFTAAISAYERVLEIDPQHEEARYIISHVYINGKEYEKAEILLTNLVKEFPNNFQLLNNLAWLYATAEDPSFRDGQKAVMIARKAMVLAPTDHHVWSTLSEGYYVSGEYEKAYRAITHMASLATRYGKGITKEAIDGYNEQILKCKRAMETAAAMEEQESN